VPTAYLSPSQLQDLTNVSSTAPSSGDNGKALVWNNTAGKWQAEQVAYSNLSGAPALPIPVGSGGTGTQTGSITGTGALTFAAGGTNQDIALNPTGSGAITATTRGIVITQPSIPTCGAGLVIQRGDGFFRAQNGTCGPDDFLPNFLGRAVVNSSGSNAAPSLFFSGHQCNLGNSNDGVIQFRVTKFNQIDALDFAHVAFVFNNSSNYLITISGSGDTRFLSTTDSTLTTNGAVRIDGGVGIAKNLNVGGTIKGLGAVESGTPASATATGTAGQVRWDTDYIYVCTATNTWKRVAISTW
jgi:hypothetical protein